jgi:hypothetical protein
MTRDRRAIFAALAALTLLLLIVWGPVLLGLEQFWLSDFVFTTTPFRAFGAAELRAGRLPEWNPDLLGGIPHLANPLAGTFSPSTLLYFVFPSWRAASLEPVIGLFVAAFATFAAARQLGARPVEAAAGGAIFAFSGAMIASSQYGVHTLAGSWLPLAVWGALAARARWLTGTVTAGASLALMVLSGEPELVPVGAGLVAACVFAVPELRSKWIATLGLAAVTAVGLSAAQLFPAAAFVPDSVRAHGVTAEEAGRWSAHPLRLLTYVWPWLFGRIAPVNSFWGGFLTDDLNDRTFMYPSIYFGAMTLPIAAVGLWRDRVGRWLAVAGALLILLALGRYTPVFGLLHHVPPLSFSRYPERYLLPVGLIAALGASLGLASLRERAPRGLAIAGGLLALASAALAIGAGRLDPIVRAHSPVPNQVEAVAQARADALEVLLAAAALTATVLLFARLRPSVRLAALVAVTAGDAVFAGRAGVFTRPTASFLTENPTAAKVASIVGGNYRFWRTPELSVQSMPRGELGWWRNYDRHTLTLRSNVPMMLGLKDAGGHSAARARVRFRADEDLEERFDAVAREASVRAIVAPWPLPAKMQARVDAHTLTVAATAPPVGVAVLELPDAKPLVRCVRSKCAADQLLPGRMRAQVDLAGSDALELAENNLPGWRATVDGQETPILETQMGFISVPLPAGKHTVELRYRAPGLRLGIAVSVMTMLLLCAAFVLRRFRG